MRRFVFRGTGRGAFWGGKVDSVGCGAAGSFRAPADIGSGMLAGRAGSIKKTLYKLS